MTSWRSRAIQMSIGLTVAAVCVHALRGGTSMKEKVAPMEIQTKSSVQGPATDVAKDARAETQNMPAIQSVAGGPHGGLAKETQEVESSAREKLGFRFERELQGYVGLKKKVFVTSEVRNEKARLFENAELIRGLEPLLKVAAYSDHELQTLQNDAIDLLIEARAVTKGEVPAEVLRSVIQDPAIESERLDMKSREALAGLKAEVLYQWTSQEPEAARDVAGWLPGPVSEKIWRNVLAAQEQNRLESLREVGR